jgi:glycosyltransferase involved in cell wall biosynthesis
VSEISVVIPTKDRVQLLRKTLPIFLAQPEVGEVVVVVDGCSDGTLEYVKQAAAADERIRYVDNVVNKGLPYSRNRGIELVTSEYVFTGEDDLEITDNFFGTLLAHLRETGADLISGRNIFQEERETVAEAVARTDRIKGPSVNRRTITLHTAINTQADQEQPLLPAPMLGRADVFRKVRYDDQYRGSAYREETDFQFSALEAGYKLVYCPHAMTFNVKMEGDRGGVHATWGFKRARWTIRNNWQFVQKHKELIARDFDAGNLYVYIAKFSVYLVAVGVILPKLVATKRKFFPNAWFRAELLCGPRACQEPGLAS